MPNESVPVEEVNPNSLGLSQSLDADSILPYQPVPIQLDGGLVHAYYTAGAPEFVGRMPLRQDLTILPRDPPPQGLINVASPIDPPFDGHTQQVVGTVDANSVLIANSWGESDWVGEAQPIRAGQGLQVLDSGYRHVGETIHQDITFFSRNHTETLRISDSGDFFIQGRLVKSDLEIYQAFRKFLGLSYEEPPTSELEPRAGIETKYQRILKKFING